MTPRVVHVSNDRYFGGVPEVIRGEIRELGRRGVAQSWLTLELDGPVRRIGKYLNDCLHGVPPRDPVRRQEVQAQLASFGRAEGERLRHRIGPENVVILHDPLALTLAPALKGRAWHTMWRSHIGADVYNSSVAEAVGVLGHLIDDVDTLAFHRKPFVWPSLAADPRVLISPPGIDPSSPKNVELSQDRRQRLLAPILTSGRTWSTPRRQTRGGGPGKRAGFDELVTVLNEHRSGWLPSQNTPYLLQVARWDRHKGHEGLLHPSFLTHLGRGGPLDGFHLVLVGPRCVPGLSDPYNVALLERLCWLRDQLPTAMRSRVHLWSFTTDDLRLEGLCVNLLQRGAHTVLQKSTREGFGLSVTEAMLKGRVVVASAVGGLRDQITRGVNGVLSEDVDGCGTWSEDVRWACTDTVQRERWAQQAQVSARRFLAQASVDRISKFIGFGVAEEGAF